MTATRRHRYNFRFIWMTCLVAAMGGLLFGYDWVVIGGAKPFYELYFGISGDAFYQGLAINSALIGCLFGAIIAGILSDRLGRKRLLILAGLLFTVSAVGTALAGDFVTFIIVRWIGGLGIGLASNLSPMYIAELSPADVRGRFVSIQQLTIVIGVLAAQLINWQIAQPVPQVEQLRQFVTSGDVADAALTADQPADTAGLAAVRGQFSALTTSDDDTSLARAEEDRAVTNTYLLASWNGQRGWRWMFGMETIFAAAFFLLMFFVPESPRWLIKYGRDQEASAILARVGDATYAESEVKSVKRTLAQEEIAHVRFADLLEPRLRIVLGLGIFLGRFSTMVWDQRHFQLCARGLFGGGIRGV